MKGLRVEYMQCIGPQRQTLLVRLRFSSPSAVFACLRDPKEGEEKKLFICFQFHKISKRLYIYLLDKIYCFARGINYGVRLGAICFV